MQCIRDHVATVVAEGDDPVTLTTTQQKQLELWVSKSGTINNCFCTDREDVKNRHDLYSEDHGGHLCGLAFGSDKTICLDYDMIRYNIEQSNIKHVDIVILDVKTFIDVLEEHIIRISKSLTCFR